MSFYKALRDKEDAELRREGKERDRNRKAAREAARVSKILCANPEIGMVVRKGKPMYYTGAGDNMTANIDSLVNE